MTPTIIVDFHDPVRGKDALALARSIGDTAGAHYVTVTSHQHRPDGTLHAPRWHRDLARRTEATLGLAEVLVADAPGAITRLVAASPARALHETAERVDADLIVLSCTAPPQAGGAATAATPRQALQGAPCAVALAPAGFANSDGGLSPVGIALEDSREARLTLCVAAALAEAVGGRLRVISVLERPAPAHPMFAFTSYQRHLEQLHDERRSDLIEAIDALPARPAIDPIVIDGDPADVLADHSGGLGLLVLGSRGYGPLRRVLLGSVSDALVARATCPVLIVPRGVKRVFGASRLRSRRET